jgi:hypothetical protein
MVTHCQSATFAAFTRDVVGCTLRECALDDLRGDGVGLVSLVVLK